MYTMGEGKGKQTYRRPIKIAQGDLGTTSEQKSEKGEGNRGEREKERDG